MTSKHISFGKITDYRNFVRAIATKTQYAGQDEEGNAIYNSDPLPTLKCTATVKMHGSNASVTYQDGEYLCQSRNNIVTSGHFSFPEIVTQEKVAVINMFDAVRAKYSLDPDQIITIFGEIVGPGVQKSVALSLLSQKYWIIFGIKTTDSDGEGTWLENIGDISCQSDRIFNVHEFPTFDFDIDFNFPESSQNDLVAKCLEVEACCPVAKQLENVEGVGEGIVLEVFHKSSRLTAKIKGEKHAKGSKIKKTAQLDPVLVANVRQFVEHAVTESRVQQAIHEVEQSIKGEVSRKHTGNIIKWVANDIIAEESEVLKQNKLEYAQVGGKVANQVKHLFFTELNQRPMV